MKPLTGGAKALLLFNRGDAAGDDPGDRRATRSGRRRSARACATCGRTAMRGRCGGAIQATVEPHGVAMFRIVRP